MSKRKRTYKEDWCVHYIGLGNRGSSCGVGVVYASVTLEGDGMILNRMPCFKKNGLSHLCGSCQYPTKEQLEESERIISDLIKNITTTRMAIKRDIEDRGMKNRDTRGSIPCPVCKTGTVSYSCAGSYNGHVHAQCDTDDCVSWIE